MGRSLLRARRITPSVQKMSARNVTAARRAYNASLTLGMYALVGGLISFAGWAADLPRLTDWNGVGLSIQPNATIAAMSASASPGLKIGGVSQAI